MPTRDAHFKTLVRAPSETASLGESIFRIVEPLGLGGFFCFNDVDSEVFTFPELVDATRAELVELLAESDWRSAPDEVFTQVFEKLGVPSGPGALWVTSSFLSSGPGESPVGAYAFVREPGGQGPQPEPDYIAIDILTSEIIRSRAAMLKYRRAIEDSDFLFSLLDRLGGMLAKAGPGAPVLGAVLEMAQHAVGARSGCVLVRRAEGWSGEVERGLPARLIEDVGAGSAAGSLCERVERARDITALDVAFDSGGRLDILDAGASPEPARGERLMAVPLEIEAKLVGLLCVLGPRSPESPGSSALATLSALANIASILLDAMLLRESSRAGSHAEGKIAVSAEDVLDALEDAALVVDDAGETIISNHAARRLFESGSCAALDNLELRTLVQNTIAESSERQTTIELRDGDRMRTHAAPILRADTSVRAVLIVVSEDATAIGAPSLGTIAAEIRAALARLQLGGELAIRADSRELAGADPHALLRKPLMQLVRICEDIELEAESDLRGETRICCLVELARRAFDRLGTHTIELGIQNEESSRGRALVLGSPGRLELALNRVFAEIDRLAEEETVELEAREERGELTLRFAFYGHLHDELVSGDASDGEPESRDRAGAAAVESCGFTTARAIVRAHRGQIRVRRGKGGLRALEISLPAAPASPAPVVKGKESGE